MPSSPRAESEAGSHRVKNGTRSRKSYVACDRCRVKKIKCDGTQPCNSCNDHGANCHYSRTVRKYRGSGKNKTQDLQQRLGDAERLLRSAGLIERLNTSDPTTDFPDQSRLDVLVHAAGLPDFSAAVHDEYGSNAHHVPGAIHNITTSYEDEPIEPSFREEPSSSRTCATECPTAETVNNAAGLRTPVSVVANRAARQDVPLYACADSYSMPSGGTSDGLNPTHDPDDIEQSPSRDECHGPHSFLSICTDPGVEWIASRIGVSNYATYATSLESHISKKFKLRERLSKERVPEPSQETAWLYTNAYFENCLEASFNIIDRSSFETRLRNLHQDLLCDDDLGWYALRNAVYATGCRIATFQSCTWTQAQSLSRGYLENALAVEAELIHGTPGLTGIQALLIMAFYTEGVGAVKLEYMLIGCAVRLSHARGLHLRPNSSKLTFEGSQRRSWLFWTLYCFEKHLTLRSGRPSAIDDDDISCELPTWAPGAHPQFISLFACMVKQAKLSSAIAKGLLTVKARSRSLADKIKLVKHFDAKLTTWYANLPDAFKAAGVSGAVTGIRAEHFMYLHLCHHGNMAVVHSIFGHPWNLNNAADDAQASSAVRQQIALSDEALSHAARSIVLLTRSITIDAAAPTWLVFYFPLVGLINIFISVLKHLPLTPSDPKPPRDMGIVDMAAGYFAYLDYSTDSVISFALVRNLAQWARAAVGKVSGAGEGRVEGDGDEDVRRVLDEGEGEGMGTGISACDIDGMDFTDWPSFLPRLPVFGGWS